MVLKSPVATETSPNGSGAMELSLRIVDSELRNTLSEYEEGRQRHDFAMSALKIGAIALRQAQGRVDAERVREEGDRFIENVGNVLEKHQRDVTQQIDSCLKEYFDPDSGRFNERIKRLVENDGELERVLRGQIGGNGSELAGTLDLHVGRDSPLMQTLDPKASDGLISQIAKSTELTLSAQRERMLKEFSLDNGEGALSRMVAELKKNHGKVGEALENRIEAVTSEFSLDREDSALSHLVRQVKQAHDKISGEFSLDAEGSALARMRKELLETIEAQRQTNEKFQGDVIERLADMAARKQESERSTRHGVEFEEAVFKFVDDRSQKAGDIASATGTTKGRSGRSRKGDAVVELGPESVAAGARIVIEAKQNASFTLADALDELEEARANREAGIGLFVFSTRTAPDGLEAFARYGDDIVVAWDMEDPASDVVFEAGLSVAKALSVRGRTHGAEVGADIEAIENAVRDIQEQVKTLDDVTTWSRTIKNNSEKILKKAGAMRDTLSSQTAILDEKVGRLA